MDNSIQSRLIRLARKSPINKFNPGNHQSKDILTWIELNLTTTPFKLDSGEYGNNLNKFMEPNTFEIQRLNKSVPEHDDISSDTEQYFGYMLFRHIGGSNTPRPELSGHFFKNGKFKKKVETLDIGKIYIFNQKKPHYLSIFEGSECSFLLFPVVKSR